MVTSLSAGSAQLAARHVQYGLLKYSSTWVVQVTEYHVGTLEYLEYYRR